MATEPKVTIYNVDNTVGLGLDPGDNRLNILCPVVSLTGPSEITRVSGPSEFRRLYFGDSLITPDNHRTAVYARALVNYAPIYIKRVTGTNMRGGITSGSASDFYVDSNYNPITGRKVVFSLDSGKVKVPETVLSTYLSTYEGYTVRMKNDIYAGPEFEISDPNEAKCFKDKVTLNSVVGISLASETKSSFIVAIGNTSYTVSNGVTDLNDLLTYLVGRGFIPQIIECNEEGKKVRIVSGSNPSIDFDDGTVKYIGWVSPVGINISKSDSSDTSLSVSNDTSKVVTKITIKTEEENLNTWQLEDGTYVDFVLSQGSDPSSDAGYLIYVGESDPNPDSPSVHIMKKSIPSGVTFLEFKKYMFDFSKTFLLDVAVSGNDSTFVFADVKEVKVEGDIKAESTSVNSALNTDKFAIISKFPSDKNYMSINLSVYDEDNEVYQVDVNFNGISESWRFGFNADLVDGYGVSLYYENINDSSDLIHIVYLGGEAVINGLSTKFGSQVTASYIGTSDIADALSEIPENEEAPVMFDYICDGGIVDSSLSNVILSLCDKYHSFYPVSVPEEKFTEDSIIAIRNFVGSNSKAWYLAESQRDSMLDSGIAVFPGSFYYLRRRIQYANTSSEFGPVYGSVNGDLGITSPIQKFTLKQRERLLDNQINTLKRNPSTGGYYLNNNYTAMRTDSFLQEDSIVLMVNKVNQVAEAYGTTLLSENITEELMRRVEGYLTSALSTRLRVGTQNGPISIRVQCNSSNNPASLTDSGKLRIDIFATFTKSLKEVLIYTNILSMSN